jgi:hypothetical protein
MAEILTNSAMKEEAGERLAAIDRKLLDRLAVLRCLLTPEQLASLEKLEISWQKYQKAIGEFARSEFDQGSNGPLSADFAMVAEAERKIKWANGEIDRRRRR